MKCNNCNIEISADNSFCPNCGTTVTELQNLASIKQNDPISINQNNTAQVIKNDIQRDTTINPLNNNTELETPVQSLNNNVGLEAPVQTLNNNAGLEVPVQTLNNNAGLEVPVQTVNNGELEPPVQAFNNNMGLENSSQTMNSNFQQDIKEEKRKKPILIPTIILVMLIVLLGVGAIFYGKIFVKHTPKQVFTTAIESIFTNTTTLLNQNHDIINGKFSLKTNINSDSEEEDVMGILNILNKMFISLDYNIDYKDKLALVSFNSTYENSELLKSDVYLKNKKGYASFNNIYDKYISADIEDYDDIFEKIEYTIEYQNIFDEIQVAITSSLKDEYFVKEETNGIIKNILFLNYKNSTEFSINILTYLKNSTKFKESYSKFENIEIKEVTDTLTEFIDELNNLEETTNVIKISIYTDSKTKEFIKFEFDSQEENVSINVVTINKKGDKYTTTYISENEEVFSADITIKKEGENTNFKFFTKLEGFSIDLDINYSIKYNNAIKKIDISNSVDYKNITEEEFNKIYENFMNIEGIKKMVSAYETMFGSISDNIKNPNCSSAYNCQEGLDGIKNCDFIDSNGDVITIQCEDSKDLSY